MLPYWVLFLLPVIALWSPLKGDAHVRAAGLFTFAVFAVGMIGLRFQVGGDWDAYLEHFHQVDGIGLVEAMALSDPGYMAINWFSSELGLGIAGVNGLGGALFIYGLVRFCKFQPYTWLGLVVATPFLIVVTGMGYSRQAIALGFIFWAMAVWSTRSFVKFATLIFVAALFHKTAAVMFLFAIFINKERLFIKCALIIPVFLVISYFLIVTSGFDAQYNSYIVSKDYESGGGFIRVLMNAVPAALLLLLRKRFSIFPDSKLWILVSLFSLVSIPLVLQYSTVVDRFALYLAPLQIAFYSRLPIFVSHHFVRALLVLGIVIIHAMVLFVWLNFGNNAEYWLPYRWIPAQ